MKRITTESQKRELARLIQRDIAAALAPFVGKDFRTDQVKALTMTVLHKYMSKPNIRVEGARIDEEGRFSCTVSFDSLFKMGS
jgi:hypothetical protein